MMANIIINIILQYVNQMTNQPYVVFARLDAFETSILSCCLALSLDLSGGIMGRINIREIKLTGLY